MKNSAEQLILRNTDLNGFTTSALDALAPWNWFQDYALAGTTDDKNHSSDFRVNFRDGSSAIWDHQRRRWYPTKG